MTALGERRVYERDNAIGLLVRTTRRWFPWDVWIIVETEGDAERWGGHDPTYGARGFEPRRGLAQFYVDDITYYAKKIGARHRERVAERLAVRRVESFLTWRGRQRDVEQELVAHA